jgi:hypothetical protein
MQRLIRLHQRIKFEAAINDRDIVIPEIFSFQML